MLLLCLPTSSGIQLFWEAFDQKHLITAHELLDKALRIDPDFLTAIMAKGATFMAGQNPDSAYYYLNRALVIDPESSEAYGLKGECMYFTGNLDVAIEHYQKAIDLGGRLWYHVALGRAYRSKNEILKALPHYSKGLGLDPESLAAVYNEIAISFLNLGDYEKTKQYSRKSIELGKCFEHATLIGSAVLVGADMVQGNIREALQVIDVICQDLACQQGCPRLYFQASVLLKDFEKAEQYFSQRQQVDTEYYWEVRMNYEIAYVFHQLGRTEEAERLLIEQMEQLKSELGKGYWTINLDLARIQAFRGKKKESLTYLKQYAQNGVQAGQHDFLLIDPFFENLRDDPEFKEIVKNAQQEKAAMRQQVR